MYDLDRIAAVTMLTKSRQRATEIDVTFTFFISSKTSKATQRSGAESNTETMAVKPVGSVSLRTDDSAGLVK